MNVQSISSSVPGPCCNECEFCVSRMRCASSNAKYMSREEQDTELYKKEYQKRLRFAVNNGCNTMIFTGEGEPLLNMPFIEKVLGWNDELYNPIDWLEIQTSGSTLDDKKLHTLRDKGISVISLSLSSAFCSKENALYNKPKADKYFVDIDLLCREIKKYNMILRLSLNMTDFYNNVSVKDIFDRVRELEANQVTFRILYKSKDDTPQNRWIDKHRANPKLIKKIEKYVKKNGNQLEMLPFGAMKYSVGGVSTVVDNDCMSKKVSNTLKYLILSPDDCKIRSRWDDVGSLIF